MSSVFVDRIEGKYAVLLDDDQERVVPLAHLPKGTREGMWLTPDLKSIDAEAEARVRQEISDRRARLMKEDDGGDFSL